MCDPVSITLGAISVGTQAAGAIVKHKATNQAAAAEDAYAAQRLQQVTTGANRSAAYENKLLDEQSAQDATAADQQIQAIALRRKQEGLASRQSVVEVNRAAQMSDATARLSAGAAGVAGASVSAILNDVQRQEGMATVAVGRNLAATNEQLDAQSSVVRQNLAIAQRNSALQREGIEVNRQNRIAEVSDVPTAPKANPWLTGLQIVGSAVDAVTTYKSHSKPK